MKEASEDEQEDDLAMMGATKEHDSRPNLRAQRENTLRKMMEEEGDR